jgi:hypothetical protein
VKAQAWGVCKRKAQGAWRMAQRVKSEKTKKAGRDRKLNTEIKRRNINGKT